MKKLLILLALPILFVTACSDGGTGIGNSDPRIFDKIWVIDPSTAIPYFEITLNSADNTFVDDFGATGTWVSKSGGDVIETTEKFDLGLGGSITTKVKYTTLSVTDSTWSVDYEVRVAGTNTGNGTTVMTQK